ncbi:tyrosine-protein phosphatase non-receptor type 23-like [Paramacrobiotus metropolitanus]|uniref:tyrosine-protein phosphatase non-receptor type 23-like n=1 Tax=Paramacrobiotus metropolitanus TaxID=2943436 RepID=UPI0024459D92|nr:tyrosine-protein phosphatase non-receptor type 23-like [Paramacrobiotus metropolitanus]
MDLPATPPMFEPSNPGASKTPSPTDDVFDATVLPNKVTERPDSRKGYRFPSPKQHPGSHIGASDYTPRRYLTKTPPEKIDNPQFLRQRIYELQNQLLAGQNIVESTENVLSQTVASHKQERKRLTDELERANTVIDDLTQEIERLEAQLQVTEEPCRHDQAEVTRLQDMLEQSQAEVATLRQDLEQRLQALGYSEAGSAELHNMFGRVDEYREENHHLKQGIIGLEGEIDELNSELDFLRTAYENLRQNQNGPEGVAVDLRLCQAQLGQQIFALTTHLQNETARFEHARVENLAVIEAQRARITQLESEKTQWETDKDRLLKYQQELYDFGTDVSNKYNDLCEKHNQLVQERENLGIEVACLKEEKTYLEDSMTEQPPSSRTAQEQDKCQQINDYLRRDNPLLNPTGQTGALEGQIYHVGMLRAEPSVGPRPPMVPSAPEPEQNTSTANPNAPTHSTTTTTTAYGGTSTTTMFSTGTRPVASTSTGQDQPRGTNLRAPVTGPGMGLRPPTNASAGSSQPNSGNSNRDRQRSGSQNTYPPRIEVQPVSAGQRNWADPVRPGYPDNAPQQPRLDNRDPINLAGPGAVGNVPYQPQQGNMDPIGPAPQADQYVVIPPGMWLDQNRVLQRIPGYVAPNQPPNQGNGAQNPPPGPGQPQQPAPPGNPYPQPQPYPPQPAPAAQNQQAAYPIGWNPPVSQQAAPVAQPRQTPPPDEQDIAQARLEGYEEGRRRYEERNNRILARKKPSGVAEI